MRVLLTLSSGRIGGAEVHTHWLARAMRDRPDFEVTVACRPGALAQRLEADGIPWVSLPFSDGLDVYTPLRLAWLARGFDVLHAHMNRAALYTRVASFLSGTPWVATAHGMTKGVYYRGASRVVAVSHGVGAHMQRQGIGGVVVVHNGLPPPDEAPEGEAAALRARLGAGPEDVVLLVLATHHENKGQALAVEALAQLPPRFHLLCTGNDVDDGCLRDQARRLGVEDRALFCAPFDGTAVPMGAADAVLVPSGREAFSLVAAEARMRGLPVVASDVDGLREVASDDAPGVARVPARTAEAWAQALRDLGDQLPERRRRARAGAQEARRLFALERWVGETLPVYAAAQRGRPRRMAAAAADQ